MGNFSYHWICCVAPIAGGLIAAGVHKILHDREEEKDILIEYQSPSLRHYHLQKGFGKDPEIGNKAQDKYKWRVDGHNCIMESAMAISKNGKWFCDTDGVSVPASCHNQSRSF